MRHAKHLLRAGLILLFGGIGAFLFRNLLIPKSFGEYGFYRGDAVRKEMARPGRLGPADVCRSCHAPVWDQKENGKHAALFCVGCHAPLDTHAEGKKKIAAMWIQKEAALCLRCHQKQLARPADFPQVDPDEHLAQMGVPMSPAVCFDCHNPHHPTEGL